MLKTVVETGVPVLVFFAMVVVGMELTAGDFRRVARPPRTVVAATAGQFVLLPVLGWRLAGFPVPFAVPAGQPFLLLVLTFPTGMGTRRRPEITKQYGRTSIGFSLATLAALLGFIIVQKAAHFASAQAFGAGWATGWASAAVLVFRRVRAAGGDNLAGVGDS